MTLGQASLDAETQRKGVVIETVMKSTPAGDMGLSGGDLLIGFDRWSFDGDRAILFLADQLDKRQLPDPVPGVYRP